MAKIIRRILLVVLIVVIILVVVLPAAFITAEVFTFRKIDAVYGGSLDEGGFYKDVGGISVFYREYGKGKPPLLLIHGLLGSAENFANEYSNVAEELSKDRTVIAIDLPGFGNSEKSAGADYSKKSMAETAAALMKALGYEKYSVLGHSMGGEVAMRIALDNPGAVDALILVDSAGYEQVLKTGSRVDMRIAISYIPPFVFENIVLSYFLQKQFFKLSVFNSGVWDESVFYRAYLLNKQIPGETFRKFVMDDDSGSEGWRLGEISCPTLIIWGRQDKIIPVENAYLINEKIKGSRLEIIENCGHLPFIEQEGKFLEIVKSILPESSGFFSSAAG